LVPASTTTDTLLTPSVRAEVASRAAVIPRLSVGVVVDLFLEPEAGGHVKCWERLAEAAVGREDLALTVYFLGKKREIIPVGPNVCYVTRRPLLDTNWFRFLGKMPDHTDLAPFHPSFLKYWRQHHLIHTTDAFFTLANTALRFARVMGRPLVNSIHTDTPGYTRVYTAQAIRELFGEGVLSRFLCEQVQMHERIAQHMQARLERYLRRCDWVLGNDAADLCGSNGSTGPPRCSVLRRGIDKDAFHPRHADPRRLRKTLGIPDDRFILLCVGRVNPGKGVMTLAQAARTLLDRGVPVHVIFAGDGSQKQEVRDLLGEHVSLPGSVSHRNLPWLYASSDLFVFPSQIEVSPNVVVEAKSCGVPVVVSSSGGSARILELSGNHGVQVKGNDPADWAAAIESLLRDPSRRQALAVAARRSIEDLWPSWEDVLEEDLLPVWQRVAGEKGVWGQ
jgi:glycosyltransferase involved in cell wall biosynthesis